MRVSLKIAPIALAAFIAISPAAHAVYGVSTDRIVLGQAAALSGPAAALGQNMKVGLEAAFAEVNKAGGVKGRKLELRSVDDGYEPTRSVGVVKKLLEEDKVFAIVGTVGTPTAAAIQPIATNAGVPMIGAFTGVEFLREPYKPFVNDARRHPRSGDRGDGGASHQGSRRHPYRHHVSGRRLWAGGPRRPAARAGKRANT